MMNINRLLIWLVVLTTLNFCISHTSFSEEIILTARNNITTHRPESVSTPEKDLPVEATVSQRKGNKSWLWVAIAIIAVAGGAASAGGSGGNGGGNNGGGTGSINVSW